MRVKIPIAIVTLLCVLIQCLFNPAVGALQNRTYEEHIRSTQTDEVMGVVTKLEYFVQKQGNLPFTIAEISIAKVKQGTFSAEKTIKVYYEGGYVNDKYIQCYRNPWGIVELSKGDKVILHITKDIKLKGASYVLGAEIIEPAIQTKSAPSTFEIYESHGLGFEWAGEYFTDYGGMDYKVATQIIPNEVASDAWYDAILDSFETWEDDARSDFDFTCTGNTSLVWVDNDQSEVGWNDLSGALAYCYVFPTGSSENDEFDIIMNTDFDWSVGAVAGDYDIQNTMTHEIGHTLTLGDLYDAGSNSDQTMYYYSDDAETKKRSLATGDQTGAQFLAPHWDKPDVTLNSPTSGNSFDRNEDVDVVATATSSEGSVQYVKFKVTEADNNDYDSDWITMSYSSGAWRGTWNTGTRPAGDYYVTVRVQTSYGMYGYRYATIELTGNQ